MADAPAFFRAIEANPDDDTPRLVLADWLDENAATDAGRARAEFIRVQCLRARLEPADPLREQLKDREAALLDAHGAEWSKPWPVTLYYPTYERGFLDPVSVGPAFARHAARLAELMPLHHLQLYRGRSAIPSLAACPQLALIRHLTLVANGLRVAEAGALAASPHLGNLRALDVSVNKLGPRAAASLAAANLPALRALCAADNPLKDSGLLALVRAGWPNLEELDASRCELMGAGVRELASGPLAARLTSLQLSGNTPVPAGTWLALARAPLSRLRRLDMSTPAVTDDVAEALAANAALANLCVLHLGAATVTDGGARAVLNSPHLRGLTRLRLPERTLSAGVREQLRAAFGDGFNPRA